MSQEQEQRPEEVATPAFQRLCTVFLQQRVLMWDLFTAEAVRSVAEGRYAYLAVDEREFWAIFFGITAAESLMKYGPAGGGLYVRTANGTLVPSSKSGNKWFFTEEEVRDCIKDAIALQGEDLTNQSLFDRLNTQNFIGTDDVLGVRPMSMYQQQVQATR